MTDREKQLKEAMQEWRSRANELIADMNALKDQMHDLKIKLTAAEAARDEWMERCVRLENEAPASDWRDARFVRDRDGSVWTRLPRTHKWICIELNGIVADVGCLFYESELDKYSPITIINDLDEDEWT